MICEKCGHEQKDQGRAKGGRKSKRKITPEQQAKMQAARRDVMITRALIIRKPHIDQILDGSKTWEMRSTKTNVRGRIALIEGGSGLIVGECVLADSPPPLSRREIDRFGEAYHPYHGLTDVSLLHRWSYIWRMKDAKRYAEPIPYKHPTGAVIWVDLKKLGVVIP